MNEKGSLQEAAWTQDNNEGRWYPGTLSNAGDGGFKVEPGSVLTAAVFEHYLRVYYQAKEGRNLSVAWVVKGEESWAPRKVVNATSLAIN